jgi:PAS domain-containing protein
LFHILDSVPDIVVILNKQRQIVFSNHSLVKFTGIQSVNNSYGLRVGEILDCIHSSETPGRCGTTEFCSECGAVRAILNSQAGKADVQECRIIQK